MQLPPRPNTQPFPSPPGISTAWGGESGHSAQWLGSHIPHQTAWGPASHRPGPRQQERLGARHPPGRPGRPGSGQCGLLGSEQENWTSAFPPSHRRNFHSEVQKSRVGKARFRPGLNTSTLLTLQVELVSPRDACLCCSQPPSGHARPREAARTRRPRSGVVGTLTPNAQVPVPLPTPHPAPCWGPGSAPTPGPRTRQETRKQLLVPGFGLPQRVEASLRRLSNKQMNLFKNST